MTSNELQSKKVVRLEAGGKLPSLHKRKANQAINEMPAATKIQSRPKKSETSSGSNIRQDQTKTNGHACFNDDELELIARCRLTTKAEPSPTRDVNRDSGTDSANGGWLR